MKKKRIVSILLASTMLLSCFTGCTDSKKSNGENKLASEQVLKTIMFDPVSLDSSACYEANATTVLGAVLEGLVRISNDGKEDKVEPAGAESWTTSEDGLEWTFKLRKNQWTDGKPVIAQHYVDAVIRLLDKEKAFPYAFFGFDIKNGEAYYNGEAKAEDVGVKAVDDYTLKFTLEHPVPYFLSKLSYTVFKPIRLDVIEAAGDAYESDYTKHVFNGPFVIEKLDSPNSLVLAKNDKFWDAKNVKLDKVEMTNVKEFATQAQLFESGQLDVTGATQEYVGKWEKEAKEGKFQAKVGDRPSLFYVEYNQINGGLSGIMANTKVRKAIGLALDREEFTKELYGRYTPAYGYVPKVISVGDDLYRDVVKEPFKDEVKKYNNNSKKLKELLHEGLKEINKDTDKLSDIKVTYLTYGQSELERQRAEWWKQQIESKLGITVEVKIEGDWKLFQSTRKANQYDFCMSGWTGDYNDPMTFLDIWETDGGNNDIGYSNPKYDEKLKVLRDENDEAKRLELYKELEQIVIDDMVVSPIFYEDARQFIQNDVKGFQTPAFGPSYEFRWAYKVEK